MQEKPLIGITGHYEESNKKYYVDQRYVDAVKTAGGVPIILPIFSNASRFLEIIDGLLLTGGGIHPLDATQLKKKILPSLQQQNPMRYAFERFLILKAHRSGMPMLGICRGHQMIGEVLGGDVSSANPRFEKKTVEHNQKKSGEVPTHDISIKQGSLLGKMMGVKSIMVNSLHRQRLLSVPKGFSVSAVADDKAIEAIESKDGLVIGVQFHPEKLLDQDDAFVRIFRHLIRTCNKKRSARF